MSDYFLEPAAFTFHELFFGRHAQSQANLAMQLAYEGDERLMEEIRHQHTSAVTLTPLGIQQAQMKGEYLHRENLLPCDVHLVSPYARTVETALYMAPGADWSTDARLQEREWGPMDQISWRERTERWPTWATDRKADPFNWRPENGETLHEVALRVRDLLCEHGQRGTGQRIYLQSHGETGRALQASVEHIDPNTYKVLEGTLQLQNAQVIHYRNSSGTLWKRTIDPVEGTVTPWHCVVR